jgi:CHRD domain
MPASAAPGAHSPRARAIVTLHLGLTAMPQGQFALGTRGVSLIAYGFTPGSRHEVAVSVAGNVIPVGTLTANPVGSVNWSAALATVSGALAGRGVQMDTSGNTSASFHLVVLNAGQGTPVIAQTPAIPGFGRYPILAVEPGQGVITPGSATIVYNPGAKTITVTVNSAGFTPGAHAAHIHVGSCQQQGPIAYMLKDFTAGSRGVISNETRVITGVTAAKLSGGWYLNLHQGNSGNILSNGQPTIYFRPLECANI